MKDKDLEIRFNTLLVLILIIIALLLSGCSHVHGKEYPCDFRQHICKDGTNCMDSHRMCSGNKTNWWWE